MISTILFIYIYYNNYLCNNELLLLCTMFGVIKYMMRKDLDESLNKTENISGKHKLTCCCH